MLPERAELKHWTRSAQTCVYGHGPCSFPQVSHQVTNQYWALEGQANAPTSLYLDRPESLRYIVSGAECSSTKYCDGGLYGSVVVQTWCNSGPMPWAVLSCQSWGRKGKKRAKLPSSFPPSPFLCLPPIRPPSFLPSFTNQLILTIVFSFGKSFLPTSYTSTPSCSVLFFSLFFFSFSFFFPFSYHLVTRLFSSFPFLPFRIFIVNFALIYFTSLLLGYILLFISHLLAHLIFISPAQHSVYPHQFSLTFCSPFLVPPF